jgi:hypothetical protein
MKADERDIQIDAMAMRRQRFTTGRRVGHKSRYYNGGKDLKQLEKREILCIIECTNIETSIEAY